jgi:asparagine synthase (glutamine-hydrolysing)
MCGVTGVFHYKEPRPVDRDLLVRMTRRLVHRGPDDEGFHIDGSLGLGHRRLSIVDLSATGKQPMLADDGSAISYNGEAYDHAAWRPRLEARGVRFRGSSDTETLLHLLRLYGPHALAEIAGIFGIAFWDAPRKRLILARDPLGVKQLYFHDDGNRVVFASELKALFADKSVPRAIDETAFNEYLHFHTPLFERTFFKDIKQLRAGEYLEVNEHGLWPRSYWSPAGFGDAEDDPTARVAELETLITSVVREQLMSDVPVGAFFSGGIDSTAVAAFAARSGRRLRCYGVHFAGAGVIDERPFQESAAKSLGLDLELTTFDGAKFPDELAELMFFQDQPIVGPALVPMFHVSRLAARDVKVCLGGQAADEIFGGYARHALIDPLYVLASWTRDGARAKAAPRAPGEERGAARVGGNLAKQLFDRRNLQRLLAAAPSFGNWRTRYFEHFAKVPVAAWSSVLARPDLLSRDDAYAAFHQETSRSPARAPIDKVFHWEMRTYLTALFQQDDRMSMANSLESRVPLADPRIVRFALQTPATLKLRAGATKWILRKAVASSIPEEVLNRRKVGFDTPAERWLSRDHAGWVHDLLLSSKARSRGLMNGAGVERWLAAATRPYWFDVVWKLVSVELWARIFLDVEADDIAERTSALTLARAAA